MPVSSLGLGLRDLAGRPVTVASPRGLTALLVSEADGDGTAMSDASPLFGMLSGSCDTDGVASYTSVLSWDPAVGPPTSETQTATRAAAETTPYFVLDENLTQNVQYRSDITAHLTNGVALVVGYVTITRTGVNQADILITNVPPPPPPEVCSSAAPAIVEAVATPGDRNDVTLYVRTCGPEEVSQYIFTVFNTFGPVYGPVTVSKAAGEAGQTFALNNFYAAGMRVEAVAQMSAGGYVRAGCAVFTRDFQQGSFVYSASVMAFNPRGPALETELPAPGAPALLEVSAAMDGPSTQAITFRFASNVEGSAEYALFWTDASGNQGTLIATEAEAEAGVVWPLQDRFGDAGTHIVVSIARRNDPLLQFIPLGCVIVQYMEGLDCRDSGISIVPYEEGNSCVDERLIQTQLHITDQMGHVTQVLDYQSTGIIEEHAYFPYGDLVRGGSDFCGGSSAEPNGVCGGQGYLGQDRDEGAVGWNLHARMLFDGAYRFESPDPVLNTDLMLGRGWNRYAYGANNPMSYSDSKGLLLDDENLKTFYAQLETSPKVKANWNAFMQSDAGGWWWENLQDDPNTTYRFQALPTLGVAGGYMTAGDTTPSGEIKNANGVVTDWSNVDIRFAEDAIQAFTVPHELIHGMINGISGLAWGPEGTGAQDAAHDLLHDLVGQGQKVGDTPLHLWDQEGMIPAVNGSKWTDVSSVFLRRFLALEAFWDRTAKWSTVRIRPRQDVLLFVFELAREGAYRGGYDVAP